MGISYNLCAVTVDMMTRIGSSYFITTAVSVSIIHDYFFSVKWHLPWIFLLFLLCSVKRKLREHKKNRRHNIAVERRREWRHTTSVLACWSLKATSGMIPGRVGKWNRNGVVHISKCSASKWISLLFFDNTKKLQFVIPLLFHRVLDIDSCQRVALATVKNGKKLRIRVPYR